MASESPTEPTNYFLCDAGTGSTIGLTNFEDPTPQIRGISQELLTYERADGVPLSGTLYLPANYEEGTKLPLVVWAYPLEYNDVSTAGQVTNSTSRALRMRGPTHLALLLAGYAVLDNATMPIVGDPETMNDTFIEQIVAASQAAIDACVERGVCDADHVVVGGHSYGAFMTANLLAHCDLFRAGIARSRAYNRSLTPFGFQSERRTIWEARDAYIELSPFFVADRIDEPLLMIHGEMDDNSGTYPIQSERLFAAIKGNGGSARLVFLPPRRTATPRASRSSTWSPRCSIGASASCVPTGRRSPWRRRPGSSRQHRCLARPAGRAGNAARRFAARR
ncbi:MAG: prolyl oligopeptidase family serine peptidase [Planctomycetota bacterium]